MTVVLLIFSLLEGRPTPHPVNPAVRSARTTMLARTLGVLNAVRLIATDRTTRTHAWPRTQERLAPLRWDDLLPSLSSERMSHRSSLPRFLAQRSGLSEFD